jgi:CRP/FNR family transcriptional regulator, cyclic AMP receptor protein
MDPPIELLEQVTLFSGLDKKELQRLSTSFKEQAFSPGQRLAEEGTRHDMRLYVIAEGTAAVSVGGVQLRRLGPGDAFGEVALIDGGERSATVVAETAVRCFGLAPWVFRPLVEENPNLGWKMLEGLAKLLREAQERDDAPPDGR